MYLRTAYGPLCAFCLLMEDFYARKAQALHEVALALLFILDHQQLDRDAAAAAELARRRLMKVERKPDKA